MTRDGNYQLREVIFKKYIIDHSMQEYCKINSGTKEELLGVNSQKVVALKSDPLQVCLVITLT